MKPGMPGRYNTMRWPMARSATGRWEDRLRLREAKLVAAWAAFLGRVPWDVFVTLTFDEKRRARVPQMLADKEAFWFVSLAARALRRPLGWAYATEPGDKDRWHAHVLIIGARVHELRAVGSVWMQANGFLDVKRVVDSGAALYASKRAAVPGEVVLSDTIERYIDEASPTEVVALYPGDNAAEGVSAQ